MRTAAETRAETRGPIERNSRTVQNTGVQAVQRTRMMLVREGAKGDTQAPAPEWMGIPFSEVRSQGLWWGRREEGNEHTGLGQVEM